MRSQRKCAHELFESGDGAPPGGSSFGSPPGSLARNGKISRAGSGVRKAEAKKGEEPDPTHKLQALIAAQRKSAAQGKAAPADTSSDDDY